MISPHEVLPQNDETMIQIGIRTGLAYLGGLRVRVLTGMGTGHTWCTRVPVPIPIAKRGRRLEVYIVTIRISIIIYVKLFNYLLYIYNWGEPNVSGHAHGPFGLVCADSTCLR